MANPYTDDELSMIVENLGPNFQANAEALNLPGPSSSQPANRHRILIGVSGTPGAGIIPSLLEFMLPKADVNLIFTKSSRIYCGSGALDPRVKTYSDDDELRLWTMEKLELHTHLVAWANEIILIPASSDLLARVALGLSNDLLTRTVRSFAGKLRIVPDMDLAAYTNRPTMIYIRALTRKGHEVLLPPNRFVLDKNPSLRMHTLTYLKKWVLSTIKLSEGANKQGLDREQCV